MPSLDDENQAAELSTANDEAGAPAADENQQGDAAAAGSSTATGADEDKSLLDVVRDVVSKRDDADVSSPAAPAESVEGSENAAEADEDEAEFEQVPFHKHPSFQKVLRQRRAFKRQAETLERRIGAVEQDAVRYQNVQGFLDQSGLSAEEASDALVTAALAKTDPVKCLEQVRPWLQKLFIAAGEVLPDDLQKRVDAGELTPQAALEVSRSTAAVQSMRAAQSFREQQETRRREQEAGAALTTAASSWEAERRARDPNFNAKVEPLMKEIAWLQTKEGRPDTPQGVKDQLQRAYKAVNAAFAPPQPAPPPRRPAVIPVTGGNVAGNVRPSELSTLDIVRQHTQGR